MFKCGQKAAREMTSASMREFAFIRTAEPLLRPPMDTISGTRMISGFESTTAEHGYSHFRRHRSIRFFARDKAVTLYCSAKSDNQFGVGLDNVYDALSLLMSFEERGGATLTWSASELSIASADAAKLLARWDETREPPTLRIIRLAWDDRKADEQFIETFGLIPFSGQEVEIWSRGDNPEYAARTLARIARHVLLHGPIFHEETFIGLNAEALVASVAPNESGFEIVVFRL
jgi:hypothetical protein